MLLLGSYYRQMRPCVGTKIHAWGVAAPNLEAVYVSSTDKWIAIVACPYRGMAIVNTKK